MTESLRWDHDRMIIDAAMGEGVTADLDDLLARVDEVTAPVCGACSEPLDPDGPSLYWCDDECSDIWHRTQGEPLLGYVDPWHRPHEFPGIGSDAHVSADPSSTPDVVLPRGGTIHVPPGTWTATADGSGLRRVTRDDLGRTWIMSEADVQAAAEVFESVRVRFAELAAAAVPVFQQAAEAMRPMCEQLRRAGLVDDPPPSDPRERALAARRNRNTGPASQGRVPRTIGRPSTSARRP